jgi:hypothetical protein
MAQRLKSGLILGGVGYAVVGGQRFTGPVLHWVGPVFRRLDLRGDAGVLLEQVSRLLPTSSSRGLPSANSKDAFP